MAVDDFNMGAMENKSLNIFNSRLVLADKDTSTDGDYARIEGVVGHEYFHNWTGEGGGGGFGGVGGYGEDAPVVCGLEGVVGSNTSTCR